MWGFFLLRSFSDAVRWGNNVWLCHTWAKHYRALRCAQIILSLRCVN